MDGRLIGKVAIVTGGSQGIGAAFAKRLAAEGAKVAIVNRTPETAKKVIDEIRGSGGIAQSFLGDASDIPSIESIVSEIVDTFGGVDILVNNAGIYMHNDLFKVTPEEWTAQANLNLGGVIFFCKAAAEYMKTSGSGRIINIGSAFGQDGFPGAGIYAATKAGVSQLTKVLCLELREYQITVNCIAPGWIATDMNAPMRDIPDSEFSRLARERFGAPNVWMDPDELAGAVVFLASDDASSVNGITLPVDKGWAAY